MNYENSPANWTAAELEADKRWVFVLDDRARRDLVAAVRKACDPAKTLLDYRKEEFDPGSAWPVIAAAFEEYPRPVPVR